MPWQLPCPEVWAASYRVSGQSRAALASLLVLPVVILVMCNVRAGTLMTLIADPCWLQTWGA